MSSTNGIQSSFPPFLSSPFYPLASPIPLKCQDLGLGKSSNLVLEKLLCLLPDASSVAVLKLQQAGKQVVGESLGRLAGEKGGEVVDGDDVELGLSTVVIISLYSIPVWKARSSGGFSGENLRNINGNGRLLEGGVDGVDRDRVVGVGGVARNINNNGELAGRSSKGSSINEGGNRLRKVDAVDEDVGLDDLHERSSLGGLSHIPSDDVLLGDSSLNTEVDSSTSTSSKSTNNENSRLLSSLRDSLLDVRDQSILVRVRRNTAKLNIRVQLLVSPNLDSESGTGKSSVVSEGGNTTSGLILEELQVVKSSVTVGETGQDIGPTSLVLVAVCELDVGVDKGEGVLGELLQSEDDVVGGGAGPGSFGEEGASDAMRESAGVRRSCGMPDDTLEERGNTYAANSSSSKMRWVERSTRTSYPASRRALAVVGVRAERCSKGLAISLSVPILPKIPPQILHEQLTLGAEVDDGLGHDCGMW
jgi:hypothetical protein